MLARRLGSSLAKPAGQRPRSRCSYEENGEEEKQATEKEASDSAETASLCIPEFEPHLCASGR